MAPRYATRDAILAYIMADTEPCALVAIARYMEGACGVRPLATKEALRRLVKAGAIARVGRGYYQGTSAGGDERG